jgi:hypothetical protein
MLNGAALVALAILVLLNTLKTISAVNEIADHRAYSNDIYYQTRQFLAQPENEEASLFISIPTYSPHEKLAWGTDIALDLFLADEPRLTKDITRATHILLPGPLITRMPEQMVLELNFVSGGGTGDFAADLSSIAPEMAGRRVSFEARAKLDTKGAVRPFIRTDRNGYILGSVNSKDGFELLSVSTTIPDGVQELWAGLQFSGSVAAQVDSASFFDLESHTNLLQNAHFASSADASLLAESWEQMVRGDGSFHITTGSASYAEMGQRGDFTVAFGTMGVPGLPAESLEIFGPSGACASPDDDTGLQKWFLRLLYLYDGGAYQMEKWARIALGYGNGEQEEVVFLSQPIFVRTWEMNYYILGRELGTFYVIYNGELVQKEQDTTGVDFTNLRLPLGELYTWDYPRPKGQGTHYAHTFVEVGRSHYSAIDKPIGHKFEEISFSQYGFMPYHRSLGWRWQGWSWQ